MSATVTLPHVRICFNCRRYRQYHPSTCPDCLSLKPLGYLNAAGETVCAACAGHDSVFACSQCGREDHPYAFARCARCVLHDRLTVLLTDPSTGAVHEQLKPVFEVLINGPRPQTAIFWLMRRQQIGPRLLGQMARGEIPISHHTFNQLPMDHTRNYLRDLLVAVDVLEPYEPLIERMIPWLATLGDPLNAHHKPILDQFANWRVLRHLRRQADVGRLTKGTFQSARSRLRRVVTLLTWLEARGRSIETATQTDLEDHLATQPKSVAAELSQFLIWTHDTGLNRSLTWAYRATTEPQVTMSDNDRWTHVNTLLNDATIPLPTRIAGLLMLLFAQHITTICAMRTEHVDTTTEDRVLVTFKSTPIEMPDPLAQMLRDHLKRRGPASYVSHDNGWLFPGGNPGRPLATESIRQRLVARGIPPHSARHAALFALTGQVPHMILAQTLGISHTAAARWAALAARDWGQYVSQRTQQIPH